MARDAGGPGRADDGWIIDYWPQAAAPLPRPAPRETTEIERLDLTRLAPAAVGCQLGG